MNETVLPRHKETRFANTGCLASYKCSKKSTQTE